MRGMRDRVVEMSDNNRRRILAQVALRDLDRRDFGLDAVPRPLTSEPVLPRDVPEPEAEPAPDRAAPHRTLCVENF